MASNIITTIHDKLIKFSQTNWSRLLCFIGAIYSMKKTLMIFKWLKQYFFTSALDFKKIYGNGWVLITGSTDGIGKSFAEQFIKHGCKVALLSRNEIKLNETKEKFLKEYPGSEIELIAYDCNRDFSSSDIKELREKLEKLDDISILLNNVGYLEQDFIERLSDDEIRRMINVNISSVTFLTKIVIEKMKKRKRSLIAGSGSGLVSFRPGMRQVYTATKCYLDGFMSCLSQECPNIDFTYLEIGPVETGLNKINIPFTLQPDQFTSSAIKQLGNYTYSRGHYLHAVRYVVFGQINFLKSYVNSGIMKAALYYALSKRRNHESLHDGIMI